MPLCRRDVWGSFVKSAYGGDISAVSKAMGQFYCIVFPAALLIVREKVFSTL